MKLKLLLLVAACIVLVVGFYSYHRCSLNANQLLVVENNVGAIKSVLVYIGSLSSNAYNEVFSLLTNTQQLVDIHELINKSFLESELSAEDIKLALNFSDNFYDPWNKPYRLRVSITNEIFIISSGPNKIHGDKDDIEVKTDLSEHQF